MEDTLREEFSADFTGNVYVLILVLMEDTLRALKQQNIKTMKKS